MFDVGHSMLDIQHFKLQLILVTRKKSHRLPAGPVSNPSGSALVSHRNLIPVHDYRDFSLAAGIFKHAFQLILAGKDIHIINLNAFGLVGFPSLYSVRSGILPENGHFGYHAALPCSG